MSASITAVRSTQPQVGNVLIAFVCTSDLIDSSPYGWTSIYPGPSVSDSRYQVLYHVVIENDPVIIENTGVEYVIGIANNAAPFDSDAGFNEQYPLTAWVAGVYEINTGGATPAFTYEYVSTSTDTLTSLIFSGNPYEPNTMAFFIVGDSNFIDEGGTGTGSAEAYSTSDSNFVFDYSGYKEYYYRFQNPPILAMNVFIGHSTASYNPSMPISVTIENGYDSFQTNQQPPTPMAGILLMVSADVASVTINQTPTDSIQFVDIAEAILTAIKSASESNQITDAISEIQSLIRSQNEQLPLTELALRFIQTSKSASESIVLADSIFTGATKQISASDSLNISDFLSKTFGKSRHESIEIYDAVVASFALTSYALYLAGLYDSAALKANITSSVTLNAGVQKTITLNSNLQTQLIIPTKLSGVDI